MDAASIEQMNKVRVSLGMAPLPVPGKDSGPQFKTQDESESESEDDMSTLDKRQAAAGKNWEKLEAERMEKEDREKRKAAAKKARDAAQRYAKLEGKGLGDADEAEEMDTRSWLLQQKKRQKKIEKARKLEEELAAREQQAEYTSKDLAGVKVGHEASEFDEITGEQILTLKDAKVDDESGDDELENADLKAKEALDERLKLKKKRPDYDPTDQSEEKTVLSKYDEEIDGKKQKRFTLSGQNDTVESLRRTTPSDNTVKSKGVKISLDLLKEDAPVSDYVDPSTIKIQKPKKKKEKKTRRKTDDDDEETAPVELPPGPDAMDVDHAQANGINAAPSTKKRAFEFDDDDDLQAKLAEQRRQALKKRKKTTAAELARQMRDEMPVDEDEPEEGGLVMDETTEFVANLKRPEAPRSKDGTRSAVRPHVKDEDHDDDEDGDAEMAGQQSYADVDDDEHDVKREAPAPAPTNTTATGLEDEDTMSGQGLGTSLAMLRKRGLIEDPASADLSEKERKRTQFLASKQHLIDDYDRKAKEQREADRHSGRYDRMSNRERDNYARQQNEAREAYIARLLADMFNKEYRPDVKLEYHDEFGRSMNKKEAFKHLSHMFHGKGSGKQKTEKRLKKIEDEKREAGKGVLHAGDEGGFMNVQGREGRKQKQAGVRLQ